MTLAVNMIYNILIQLQVLFINSKHESSSNFIIIKNHHMLSTWNIHNIINHTCSTGVHHQYHVLIMLLSTNIIDLTYIHGYQDIYLYISSFKLISNMNQLRSSKYNIIYLHHSHVQHTCHHYIYFIFYLNII